MPAGQPELRPYWADLHLHTVVSPCAEVEMIPPLIVEQARKLGLGLIAVTDHNTAENIEAVQRAAAGSGIVVLPGMEVQTREEVDLICLFDTLGQVLGWQEAVYASLPERSNRPEVFGAQFVVDETGEYLRTNERLLITSTRLSLEQVADQVHRRGGLVIAAHVDRPSNSLLANLGFVPRGLALDALELTRRTSPEAFRTEHPELASYCLIVSGDAHRLAEMAAATLMTVAEPTIEELRLAFQGQLGRRVKVLV